tara:strand:- start:668 stop:1060 length:393 start_codon:yes stop_codon:yes gene_type:complete
MASKVFIKFVSEPKNDPMKSIVGIACAVQAIKDGHELSVFFAAAGTRLLDPNYLRELDQEMGEDSIMITEFLKTIGAESKAVYCSFASVKAVLGHSEGDEALIFADKDIHWSGPPGVIALATSSEVQLTY